MEKFGKKFGKKFGNFGKSSEISETGFSECSEISEIWKFRTFRKVRKNAVLFELRKFENIRSDSKTDPKVRLKVRNAGPYLNSIQFNLFSDPKCMYDKANLYLLLNLNRP